MGRPRDPESFEIPPQPEETVSVSSIDRLTAAIEKMATLQLAMLESGRAPDPTHEILMTKLTEALERVSENQIKGAEVVAKATREVHRPSNEVVPMRSVFNPRGNPMLNQDYNRPVLRCPCWVPREEKPSDNMLTREEVELLNICVDAPGSYIIVRNDDTKFKLSLIIDYDLDEVTPSRLVIKHETAFNNEYFRLMPPLHSILRQVIRQHSKEEIRAREKDVLTMDEENALIAAGKLSVAA